MTKKGFTLIELLVVVAIIGILAAVGTPIFQGFLADTKINAVKLQHDLFKGFISASLVKCSINSNDSIELVRYPTGKTEKISCSNTAKYFADSFHLHFHYLHQLGGSDADSTSYKNPYAWEKSMWRESGEKPFIGRTYIYGWDSKNYIRLISNTGDTTTNKYITSYMIKE
jgi:prepilin-type N-terminal cleavage/methylation domain-containing protein